MNEELTRTNNVLVIIVTYNAMKWVDRCYNSLRASSTPCDVLTIDNGSTDGTQEYIRKNYPEVELLGNSKNLGFGRANNIGLNRVIDMGYQYAYLLNQDAWITPDTLRLLIETSQKHPEYGILSPMQMKSDMKSLDRKFARITLRLESEAIPSHDCSDLNEPDVQEVKFVMAAHWLITRECIKTVGGFSPTFFHYGEDNNYLDRAHFFHFKSGVVHQAMAVHNREERIESQKTVDLIRHYTNRLCQASNPLWKIPIMDIVKSEIKTALDEKKPTVLHYAFRLFRDRKKIETNYQRSLKKGAFLEQSSAN